MQLCKVRLAGGSIRTGVLEGNQIRLLSWTLSEILHYSRPAEVARERLEQSRESVPLADAVLLAPVDEQEVWAAGVTYKRSEEARARIGGRRTLLRPGLHRRPARAVL